MRKPIVVALGSASDGSVRLSAFQLFATLEDWGQWRRGTPKMPWKIIDIERMTIPRPKMYGWILASPQSATRFRKISRNT